MHPEAETLISKYETPIRFISLINPSRQIDMTLDKSKAYLGKAPSLTTVTQAFGFGTSKSWMATQLNDLAEFSGCKEKLNIDQIDELAKLICTEYSYLKVTEFMDFFRKFKLGDYGKFYGAVDPMVITCALKEFMTERRQLISMLQREEELKEVKRELHLYKIKSRRDSVMTSFWAYNSRIGLLGDITLEEFREIWWLFNLGYEGRHHKYITPLPIR